MYEERSPIALINVSGPYGVGKDTMLQALRDAYGSLVHRVGTVTNRPTSQSADPSYRSTDRATMEALLSSPRWIVTRQLGGDVLYGTDVDEIRERAAAGLLCIHAIFAGADGAGRLRQVFGHDLLSIGLVAASGDTDSQLRVLADRLTSRARDSAESVAARIAHQAGPIEYIKNNQVVDTPHGRLPVFDYVVVNDDREKAVEQLLRLVDARVDLHQDEARTGRKSDRRLLVESLSSAYVGGSYFEPVSDLPAVGTELDLAEEAGPLQMNLRSEGDRTYEISSLFDRLTSRSPDDALLFGLYARRDVLMAPYLWNPMRLLDFELQVDDGGVRRLGFYAVDRQTAAAALAKG